MWIRLSSSFSSRSPRFEMTMLRISVHSGSTAQTDSTEKWARVLPGHDDATLGIAPMAAALNTRKCSSSSI